MALAVKDSVWPGSSSFPDTCMRLGFKMNILHSEYSKGDVIVMVPSFCLMILCIEAWIGDWGSFIVINDN